LLLYSLIHASSIISYKIDDAGAGGTNPPRLEKEEKKAKMSDEE
jgi:hypothetical protein